MYVTLSVKATELIAAAYLPREVCRRPFRSELSNPTADWGRSAVTLLRAMSDPAGHDIGPAQGGAATSRMLVLQAEGLHNNHKLYGNRGQVWHGGKSRTESLVEVCKGFEVMVTKPVDEIAGDIAPAGFEMTSGSGWTVQTVDRSGDEKPGSAFWSLAVATEDSGENQRLGVFISFDIDQLLKKREWQMALEQEMANVRHRVRQFLAARLKATSEAARST
jgi:hypothetical protein